MSLQLILAAILVAALSGAPGLFLARDRRLGESIASVMMGAAAIAGIVGAGLSFSRALPSNPLRLPLRAPGGEISLAVDGISAVFVIQIFLLSGLCSVYGLEYWAQKAHVENGRKLRFFFGLMTSAMALLVVARNGILFMAAWEVMTLSAFLVITTEDERNEVRDTGILYLTATKLGTLSLFGVLAILFVATGSFELAWPGGSVSANPRLADALFLLSVLAFGLKAGAMPFHVWLPGAHSNSPSHVSAVMSGVLIKTGVYGLIRVCSLFSDAPSWWGLLLMGLGVTSGVLGVAFALSQHDIKRLLAYHSIENIGIILLGLGLAMIGKSLQRPELVALGFAGCVLHVFNHGLFKGLLFLSAGAVVHATGTRAMDRLGGLSKSMPKTSLAFLLGAIAISGLPPLNGFVSELLIYLGLLRGVVVEENGAWLVVMAGSVASLAAIGALASACFVKVFGVVFLGEGRTSDGAHAHDPGPAMLVPMSILAGLCVVIGLFPATVAPVLDGAVRSFAPDLEATLPRLSSLAPFGWLSGAAAALIGAALALASFLRRRISRSPMATAPTWGCGYAIPRPTMQYTASSFAQQLVDLFSFALLPSRHRPHVEGMFPKPSTFESHVPDVVLDRGIMPVVRQTARALVAMRWLQQGTIHAYLLYMLLTAIVLLAIER
ncbi:MAG: hydrogenase [Deltaproteobacteria bacterium]|nr:hydrogenase [Deltaproteobacteria bacterium]